MNKLIFIIFILINSVIFGQKKVDQTELIKDLTIWKKSDNNMNGIFWIPNSYWRIAFEGNTNVPEGSIGLFERTFKDYVLISIIDVKINNGGNMTFKNKKEIEKHLSLIDFTGKIYAPLTENKIDFTAKTLLNKIEPMFSQMFGKMGKGMNFFLFKVRNELGKNIINESEKGKFTIKHLENKFEWTLPLSAFVEKKHCPIDNVEMNGNWNFCPFHGKELKNK